MAPEKPVYDFGQWLAVEQGLAENLASFSFSCFALNAYLCHHVIYSAFNTSFTSFC